MAESMESPIFTRAGAYNIKKGGQVVKYLGGGSKNIGMAKCFGHSFCCVNDI